MPKKLVKKAKKSNSAVKKTPKKSAVSKASYKPDRVSTGVKGLDELIEGGFLKGSAILIGGGIGTGKTIFCIQYLWEGLKKGESCVYVTLEEGEKDILSDALALGIDLKEYEKKGKFKVVEKNVFEDTNIDFFEVDKLKATRVVIDPFSLLAMTIESKPIVRQRMYETIKLLKQRGVTMVITSEALENGNRYSRYSVEEFVADGVIKLEMEIIGTDLHRSLNLVKMRKTNIKGGRHTVEIDKGGIKLVD
jgi:KaiC/GvpD/RAD55 family RecA-like ATPase